MKELTREERDLIRRLLAAGRWDDLWWELATGFPCLMFVAIGLRTGDPIWIVAGLAVYLFFRARMILYQSKAMPIWQSLLLKLGVEEIIRIAEPDSQGAAAGADTPADSTERS